MAELKIKVPRKQIEAFCKKNHIRKLAFFGSVLREDFGPMSDLDQDLTFNLALTRLIEIIGEAANRIAEEFQESHPQIRWIEIIGIRNRLIHGYDEVDFDFLWSVVRNDLLGLIKQ